MADRTKGNIALLLTALVWGSGFVAQRLGNEILPPMAFNSIRQIMAGFVLLPVLAMSLRNSGYLSREKASLSQLSYRRRKALIGGLVCGFFMLVGSMTQQIGLVTIEARTCDDRSRQVRLYFFYIYSLRTALQCDTRRQGQKEVDFLYHHGYRGIRSYESERRNRNCQSR